MTHIFYVSAAFTVAFGTLIWFALLTRHQLRSCQKQHNAVLSKLAHGHDTL